MYVEVLVIRTTKIYFKINMTSANFKQWGVFEMEKLLRCPVCFDISSCGPKTVVYLCLLGHHVCAKCRSKLKKCAVCRSGFTRTRSKLAEELMLHYEIIKQRLLQDPTSSAMKRRYIKFTEWGWSNIQDLLKCHACQKIPLHRSGFPVKVCLKGHNICVDCKIKTMHCPCHSSFRQTRNFIAEELIQHSEDLQRLLATELKADDMSKLFSNPCSVKLFGKHVRCQAI